MTAGQHGDLVFRRTTLRGTRIVLGLAGFLSFLAPYELLIRHGSPAFRLGMAPFWIISLGAVSVGGTMLAAAIFGFSRTVIVSAAERRLIVRGAAQFGLAWSRNYGFDELGEIGVREDNDTDGPPVYRLEVAIAGRATPLEIDVFEERRNAERAAASVRESLTKPLDSRTSSHC